MKKMIKYNWFFEQSAETVWKYLTTSELMAQWLMKNDFELVPGRKFMFKTNPHPDLDFDGNVYCEILEMILRKNSCIPGKVVMGVGQ